MSSGEDDAPKSDDSYDGYELPSSEEEQGDAPVYPADDTIFHEDILSDLASKASFETDKFPTELILPPPLQRMEGILGALNRKVFKIWEHSRVLVNQIYRTDAVLKDEPYFEAVWRMKHESYTDLLKLLHGSSGLEALLNKICQLGGPYYNPPENLWTYLHFFWFDSASHGTDGTSVTPVPDCAAPAFHTKFFGQIGDIDMIIDALEVEEFAIAPDLDRDDNNMALVEDFKSISLMAQQYWKSLLSGSTNSAGLYAELLQKEEMTKNKISALESINQKCCSFPILLRNVLFLFKKKRGAC